MHFNFQDSILECLPGIRYFSISLTEVSLASFLESMISCMTEIGLCVPCVRNLLNSPSVENPAIKIIEIQEIDYNQLIV